MAYPLILDAETEHLVRRIAARQGLPIAAVVRKAIERSARDAGVAPEARSIDSIAEKRRRMLEISDRSAARPILDQRSLDEILGYDEHGLPQ